MEEHDSMSKDKHWSMKRAGRLEMDVSLARRSAAASQIFDIRPRLSHLMQAQRLMVGIAAHLGSVQRSRLVKTSSGSSREWHLGRCLRRNSMWLPTLEHEAVTNIADSASSSVHVLQTTRCLTDCMIAGRPGRLQSRVQSLRTSGSWHST